MYDFELEPNDLRALIKKYDESVFGIKEKRDAE